MMTKKQSVGPIIQIGKTRSPRRDDRRNGNRSKPELLTREAQADETPLERARRERLEAKHAKSRYLRIPSTLKTQLRAGKNPTAISEMTKALTLTKLGITIPPTIPRKFHARFEEGFRHGLCSNALQAFHRSYGEGFRFAKLFVREIDPQHIFAAPIYGGRAQISFRAKE